MSHAMSQRWTVHRRDPDDLPDGCGDGDGDGDGAPRQRPVRVHPVIKSPHQRRRSHDRRRGHGVHILRALAFTTPRLPCRPAAPRSTGAAKDEDFRMTSRSSSRTPSVRWYRVVQIGAFVLGVLILVVAVALLLAGSVDWWLLALVGVINVVTAVSTLRALRRLDPPEFGTGVEERQRPEG
jgi:hypothetical protein